LHPFLDRQTAWLHFVSRPLFGLLFGLLLTTCLVSRVLADGVMAGCEPLAGNTIRWIVPTQPGGGYDAYSRLLQPFLERLLSARLLIDNQPDAGGIVAAMAIRDAAADGTTLGIINAAGLMAAHAIEAQLAPDPATDFTLLGQVVRNHMVVFTGRDSGLKDVHDLLRVAQSRPIVVGVRDAGSSSFFAIPVLADLIGMDYALVSGYVGSAARTLALMRGEIDIFVGSFDSMSTEVEAGELVALLQLTESAQDGLEVPVLGGPDGLASQRAMATGRTPLQAEQLASDLVAVVGAGRLVVAPPELPAGLAACLEGALAQAFRSEELVAAAHRARLGIDYQDSATAHRSLLAAQLGMDKFHDLIQDAIERARE
jgi:tripartite-type tricarboxylate transporter receptor subunit TctC